MRRRVHVYFSSVVLLSMLPSLYELDLDRLVLIFPSFTFFFILFYYSTLLPDVDIGSQKGVMPALTRLLIYQPVRIISKLIRSRAARHRGFMHSPLGLALTAIFWSAIFLGLGYALEYLKACWLIEVFSKPLLEVFGFNYEWVKGPIALGLLSGISVTLGYSLHLLGDSYTVVGVPILGFRVRGKLRNGVNDHIPPIIYTAAALATYTTLMLLAKPLNLATPILLAFLILMSIILWK